jgi:hypothetical protein
MLVPPALCHENLYVLGTFPDLPLTLKGHHIGIAAESSDIILHPLERYPLIKQTEILNPSLVCLGTRRETEGKQAIIDRDEDLAITFSLTQRTGVK